MCQKPDRQGGPDSKVALPYGRASDLDLDEDIFPVEQPHQK